MGQGYSVTELEDAFKAALGPLKASHGVRTLETYDVALDDPEEWARRAVRFPAVFVLFGEMTSADRGQRQMEDYRFMVGLADQSMRTGEARRGGATVGGAYALIQASKDLLNGQILLPDLMPALLRSVRLAIATKGVAMYAATYSIGQGYLLP